MNEKLKEAFSSFEGKEEDLIPLLQIAQNINGYLSDESMDKIAELTGIAKSKVFGVATFYTQFRFTPKGEKHIMLCRGTACHVKGAPRIQEEVENQIGIKVGETSEDLRYSLENVACIGACSLAPCAMVNNDVEANLTPNKVEKLFSKSKDKN